VKNKNSITDQIKTSKYAEYFSQLLEITEKQKRELAFCEALNLIHKVDYHKNIRQILKELLDFFKEDAYSCIRIVVNKKNSNYREDQIAEGVGSKSIEYAYLDTQIGDSIGKSGIVFIADSSKIHSIKFKEGFQFPKTILGMNLNSNDGKIGFIWFACEQQKDFAKVESEMLVSKVAAFSLVIEHALEWNRINAEAHVLREILDVLKLPVFLILKESIVYSNSIAQNMITNYSDSPLTKEQIIDQINNVEIGIQKNIFLNQQIFNLNIFQVGQEFWPSMKLVIFLDETILEKQKMYISLIIETISQSLKSPMNLILGAVKMVPLVGEMNEYQKKYLIDIENKAEDSLRITQELLELERITDNDGLKIRGIEISTILDQALKLVAHLAMQKRIEIVLQPLPVPQMIQVDQALFTQAIVNILEFAIGKTNLGETIRIKFLLQNKKWQIIIQDFGNGLPQVEIDKYNSFEALKEIPPEIRLVRSIIKYHGGVFKIESQIGKGRTYIVEMPHNLKN
jgi:signal transduction histidine kinase